MGYVPPRHISDGYPLHNLHNLLRRTPVNRTYGTHKNRHIYHFLLTISGPIYYGPPDWDMCPGVGLYCTDPAQNLKTVGEDLDDLSIDDLSICRSIYI